MPIYDPRSHGANCDRCPLHSDTSKWRPVPLLKRDKPVCQIVAPSPSRHAVWKNRAGEGELLDRLFETLRQAGIARQQVSVLYTLACQPLTGLNPKDKTKAKKACETHVSAYFNPQLPTLYLGNDSTHGLLTQPQRARLLYCLEFGYKDMVTDYLTTVYKTKPGLGPFFDDMVTRWAKNALGLYKTEPWPHIITDPSEEALEALRNLGDNIGWDIETQGTDPLTVPITCIGVSDPKTAVCIPWDGYYSKNWGPYPGLSNTSLGKALRAEMLKVLQSGRKMFTQNGNYDVTGLLPRGHKVRNDVDIYNIHAVMFPAMKHNLEQIGLHCIQLPYRWKLAYKKGWRFQDLKENTLSTPTVDKNHQCYEGGDPVFLRDYCAKDCYVTVVSGLRLLEKAEELAV